MSKKNSRNFLLLSLLILFVTVLFYHGNQTSSDDTLPVLTSSDAAPFSFYNGHKITGFDIDLIRHISRKINRKIRIIEVPFNSLMAKLYLCSGRESELALSAITPTKRRQKYIDLSIPYCTSRTVLIVPRSSSIQAWTDTTGKKLVVRRDTIQEDFVRSTLKLHVKNMKFEVSPAFDDNTFEKLAGHEIHGIVASLEEARISVVRYPGLRIVDIPQTEHSYCIALHKRSPLTPLVNKAILELKKEGTLAVLEGKWLSDLQISRIALSSPVATKVRAPQPEVTIETQQQ